MDDSCTKCMTISALIEMFTSITLTTLTFYYNPHLILDTKLGILLIYYGYLVINLLILTILIEIILILATMPFLGFNQSLRVLAFSQSSNYIHYQ
ncbi:unnamed protein product [Paramecium sonneborni]|uniref:Uncharacterized protein n=1 Tax=Paramecium sonneborni TaxID=65129 RepID=A0A8S1K9D2_9CILI|nr:unnamed protein product [Paramecium sonneborni]